MEYKELNQLRNKYPDERNVELSYENKNNSITYQGRYSQNSLNFTIEDISGISVVDGTSFNFIIEIDGTEYTSSVFKNLLESSLKSGNPYIQKSSVTRLKFSSKELLSAENFSDRENYAEASVTDNLKTIDDILKHIDWLVGTRQTLRDVNEYGSWSLFTSNYDVSTDTGIGLEYSEAVQTGKPYIAANEEVTNQPPPDDTIGKTLTTEVTNTTPEGGTYTTQVNIPIRYDISNPFTMGGINFVDYYNMGFNNYINN